MLRCVRLLAIILWNLTAAGLLTPASAYPDGRITLVVPFAPGGTTDAVARFVAEALTLKLGQPVVVENRPGGGTMLGSTYVINSKPDGYTLLMASADSLTTGLAIAASRHSSQAKTWHSSHFSPSLHWSCP